MAQPKLDEVYSHWHHPIADFQTSALEFYEAVTEAVERRDMPEVLFSRVQYHERGVATAKREYLRVQRERLTFDICAAPFGNGYFFSWWLTTQRSKYALAIGLTLAIGTFMLLRIPPLSTLLGALLTPISVITSFIPLLGAALEVIVWLVVVLLIGRVGGTLLEDAVSSIPLIGWCYVRLFRHESFYFMDTVEAYQAGTHGAVMEVLDALLSAKGVRALTDDERKPVMRELLKH